MEIRARWLEFFLRNKILPFIDIILKGYGQTLICGHHSTGLFIFITILFISPKTCLLTLLGIIISTLMAYWINARPLHIYAGCYGYNGVVLGIAWPCFFKLDATSLLMFVLLSASSSILLKYFIDWSSRTRTHLPVFSLPSVIVVWLMYLLVLSIPSWRLLKGPDPSMIEYIQNYQSSVLRLYNKQWTDLTLHLYWDAFKMHLLVIAFLTIGIFRHSRLSARVALATVFTTCVFVYLIGGINAYVHIDTYLYNTVPCGLALGGNFLVLNRKTWLLMIGNVIFMIWMVYLGYHIFQLSLFVVPFNLFTILSIWLVKKGILRKESGFYAVPMELVFSPETAEQWRLGEVYAQNFWNEIERSWS